MALNTADKRASSIGTPNPFVLLSFEPDGAISGVGDRAHALGMYRGIAALAPVHLSATSAADGDSITFLFDQAVSFGAGGNAGFTTTLSGGACTLTYSSGAGTASLVYGTSRTIGSQETGTVAYVQPGNGAEGASGDDVDSFMAGLINGSAADTIPPEVRTGTIDVDTDTIVFRMSEPVAIGAGGNGGFALNMSGGAATLTYSSGDGTSSLEYSISRTILGTETGTYDYTQPGNGVEDLAGNDLATFSGATAQFTADLTHNDPLLRHNRVSITHLETDLYHKDTTITHNE